MKNQTKMALKGLQEQFLANEMPPIHEKIAPLNRLEMRLIVGGMVVPTQGTSGANYKTLLDHNVHPNNATELQDGQSTTSGS